MEVSSTSGNIYYTEQNQTNTDPSVLDKDAFLRILINQLRYQNPLSPQDSESFITQMVQLTTIEQLTNLAVSMENMLQAEEFSRAVELIGKEVTVLDGNDAVVTGEVEKVTLLDGEPRLFINNKEYELNRLISIAAPVEEEPAVQTDQDADTGGSQEVTE